jgi:hypothetical protein
MQDIEDRAAATTHDTGPRHAAPCTTAPPPAHQCPPSRAVGHRTPRRQSAIAPPVGSRPSHPPSAVGHRTARRQSAIAPPVGSRPSHPPSAVGHRYSGMLDTLQRRRHVPFRARPYSGRPYSGRMAVTLVTWPVYGAWRWLHVSRATKRRAPPDTAEADTAEALRRRRRGAPQDTARGSLRIAGTT